MEVLKDDFNLVENQYFCVLFMIIELLSIKYNL